MSDSRLRPLICIKLLCTAVFWGGTFVAGRSLAGDVGPFSAAFFRFLIASLVLSLLVSRKESGLSMPPRRQWFFVLLLGLTGTFAYNFFFFKGLKLIEAGRASAIIANNPIFIAIFAALLLKEKLTTLKVAGIVISVAGAIIVIARGNPALLVQKGIGPGELYILGCVASWVAFSLLGRAAPPGMTPLRIATYSAIVGTITLAVPAFLEGGFGFLRYPLLAWANLLYLGVLGTAIGFVWYFEGIREIGATRAGLFISFVPISAVFLAYLLLEEPITASLLAGTILVSCGAYMVNKQTS